MALLIHRRLSIHKLSKKVFHDTVTMNLTQTVGKKESLILHACWPHFLISPHKLCENVGMPKGKKFADLSVPLFYLTRGREGGEKFFFGGGRGEDKSLPFSFDSVAAN